MAPRDTRRMANALIHNHGQAITAVACLAHLTDSLMNRFASNHDSDIGPLLTLQRECIKAWCQANNIDCADVHDALASLRNTEVAAGQRRLVPVS